MFYWYYYYLLPEITKIPVYSGPNRFIEIAIMSRKVASDWLLCESISERLKTSTT